MEVGGNTNQPPNLPAEVGGADVPNDNSRTVLEALRGGIPEPDGTPETGQLAEAIARGLAATGLLKGSKVEKRIVNNRVHLSLGQPYEFSRGDWQLLTGRISNLRACNDPVHYIRSTSINIGSANGISDFHLGDVSDGDGWIYGKQCCFFSCKWNSNVAGMRGYDVADIRHEAGYNSFPADRFEVGVVVAKKAEFIDMANRSATDDVKIHIEYVVDIEDLRRGLAEFQAIEEEDYEALFPSRRGLVNLLFHQHIVVQKALDAIRANQKKIALACICRSGKTYMLAGIVEECFQKSINIKDSNNPSVLIITPRPSETLAQWREVFANHVRYHDAVRMRDDINVAATGPVITICSKQGMDALARQKDYHEVDHMKYDIIAFDEAHEGAATDLSRATLERHSHKNTIWIFMTATYLKPVAMFDIPTDAVITWSLNDNHLLKEAARADAVLPERWAEVAQIHGEYYVEYAINRTNGYVGYMLQQPELKFLVLKVPLPPDVQQGLGPDGYDMAAIFRRIPELRKLLGYIFGSRDMHPAGVARAPVELIRSRMSPRSGNFISFLAFLPYGPRNPLEENVAVFIAEMEAGHPDYNVFDLSQYAEEVPVADGPYRRTLAGFVEAKVRQSKARGKTGAVFVTGNRGGVGISLPVIDGIIMMNNLDSDDQYVQRAFRCLTADPARGKTFGYVLDFRPERMLAAMAAYGTSDCRLPGQSGRSIAHGLRSMLIGNVFFVETHTFSAQTQDFELEVMHVDEAVKILLRKLSSRFRGIPDQMASIGRLTLPIELQQMYSNIFSGANIQHPDPLPPQQNEQNEQTAGIEGVYHPDVPAQAAQEEPNQSNLARAFYALMVPLMAIISYNSPGQSLAVAFDDLLDEEKAMIRTAFKWPESYEVPARDLLQQLDNFDGFSRQISEIVDVIQFLLSTADETGHSALSQQLYSYLAALNLDKHLQLLGIEAADLVLDTLPAVVWTDPSLKWLDFAVGNCMLLARMHERLFESLAGTILDDGERTAHIAGMLHAQDGSAFALRLCRMVYPGATRLHADLWKDKRSFADEKFDIIVSFPPHSFPPHAKSPKVCAHKYVAEMLAQGLLAEGGHTAFAICCKWLAAPSLDDFRRIMEADECLRQSTVVRLGALPQRVRRASGEQVLNLCISNESQPSHLPVTDPRDGFDHCIFVPSAWQSFVHKLIAWMESSPVERCSIGSNFVKGIKPSKAEFIEAPDEDQHLERRAEGIPMHVSNTGRADGTSIQYIRSLPRGSNISPEAFKVITPQLAARSEGEPRGIARRRSYVISSGHVYSESFIGWEFSTHDQAQSFLSYLKTTFVHNMVRLAKSDYVIDKNTLRWVPKLPFDRIWDDGLVLGYLGLIDDWPAPEDAPDDLPDGDDARLTTPPSTGGQSGVRNSPANADPVRLEQAFDNVVASSEAGPSAPPVRNEGNLNSRVSTAAIQEDRVEEDMAGSSLGRGMRVGLAAAGSAGDGVLKRERSERSDAAGHEPRSRSVASALDAAHLLEDGALGNSSDSKETLTE